MTNTARSRAAHVPLRAAGIYKLQKKIMIYSTNATSRLGNIVVSAGPSSLGSRLIATLRRLMSRAAVTQVPRDRVSGVAEVRAFAESVRATDPRFANDLSATADRHETLGT